MAIGYSSKFGTITSMSQLLQPKFKNAVALNGNPTAANAALNGVMMANLVEGGSASDISKGVNFFHDLKAKGNFSPVSATGATIKSGSTPVVFNWDYLNLPSYVGVSNWKVFIPSNAVLGGYYAQAINKSAPHPAAARLWEEFLYSQAATGGQNLWLQGRPPAPASSGAAAQADFAKLRAYAEQAGRDPASIGVDVWVSVGDGNEASWREEVEFWKNAGVTHLTLNTTFQRNHHLRIASRSVQAHLSALMRYREAVASLL